MNSTRGLTVLDPCSSCGFDLLAGFAVVLASALLLIGCKPHQMERHEAGDLRDEGSVDLAGQGADPLEDVLEAVLEGKGLPTERRPAIGCSISGL